jgi:hypothetical protein
MVVGIAAASAAGFESVTDIVIKPKAIIFLIFMYVSSPLCIISSII